MKDTSLESAICWSHIKQCKTLSRNVINNNVWVSSHIFIIVSATVSLLCLIIRWYLIYVLDVSTEGQNWKWYSLFVGSVWGTCRFLLMHIYIHRHDLRLLWRLVGYKQPLYRQYSFRYIYRSLIIVHKVKVVMLKVMVSDYYNHKCTYTQVFLTITLCQQLSGSICRAVAADWRVKGIYDIWYCNVKCRLNE